MTGIQSRLTVAAGGQDQCRAELKGGREGEGAHARAREDGRPGWKFGEGSRRVLSLSAEGMWGSIGVVEEEAEM